MKKGKEKKKGGKRKSWRQGESNRRHAYSGTRLESKLLVFFGFSVCSHVYLLNYRSELAQIWRQDTDTIHDHNHAKKIISMQVRSAIMGRNGRVVLGA